MTEPRFIATPALAAELEKQERSVRWLNRKVNPFGTHQMTARRVNGDNACSADMATAIADALGVTRESIFAPFLDKRRVVKRGDR